MEKPNKGAAATVGFVVGAAIATAVTLLFTTEKGEEWREEIVDWAKEQRRKNYYKKAQTEISNRKEQVESVIEAGKEAYKKVNDRVKELVG